MNGVFCFLSAVLFLVGAGRAENCAEQLQEFQTCMESYAQENPVKPFHSPPPPPNILETITRVGECFTENNCKIPPVEDLVPEFMDVVAEGSPSRGPPPEDGSGPPMGMGPPPRGRKGRFGKMMAMKRAKFECVDKIAKEDFEPTIQSCVQEMIPDWTFPAKPENDSAVFDPYGEGPLSKHAMMMKFMRMRPPPPPVKASIPVPVARVKRFMPPFMRRGGPGHRVMKILHQKLANAIFDEEICPKESRDGVTECMTEVAEEMHEDKCISSPSPPAMLIKMLKKHNDFCENRQTCYDKISEECQNSFWDQKWYIARCFDQHTETMDSAAWDSVEEKFKECMSSSLDDSDDEDDDDSDDEGDAASDDKSEADSSSQSSEEGRPGGRFRRMKLRRCISKRFHSGPVMNPCKKADGMYEMFLTPPGGPGKGPGGPPCRGPCGRHGHGPPRFGMGGGGGPPFGMGGGPPPFTRGPPMGMRPPFFQK